MLATSGQDMNKLQGKKKKKKKSLVRKACEKPYISKKKCSLHLDYVHLNYIYYKVTISEDLALCMSDVLKISYSKGSIMFFGKKKKKNQTS